MCTHDLLRAGRKEGREGRKQDRDGEVAAWECGVMFWLQPDLEGSSGGLTEL